MRAIWWYSEAAVCAMESLYGRLLPNGISGWSNSQSLKLLFKRHQILFFLIFPSFSAFNIPSFESFKKSEFQNQILTEKVRPCWPIARKQQPLLPDEYIPLCLSCPCTFPQSQLATGQGRMPGRWVHLPLLVSKPTYQSTPHLCYHTALLWRNVLWVTPKHQTYRTYVFENLAEGIFGLFFSSICVHAVGL